jgi:tetratricopeptide (TPR) repeat protein
VKLPWRGTSGALGVAHYIFAAIFLLRLLALARLTASPFLLPSRGDMHFYNDWALRILQGQLTDHLAFYGLPLYAYLLAFLYKLFGYSPFVPGLIQAALEAGTGTLLYKIGERLFQTPPGSGLSGALPAWAVANRGRIIGVAAAAGWALFVPAQAYSVILMPTAWVIFAVWFLVWRMLRLDQAPTVGACLAYGLLIGVTAMGVATILFMVPLVLAAIVLRAGPVEGNRSVIRIAGAIAMLVAGILIGTAPCWLHNRFVARDPVFLSAHSGVNFWIGNNPVANGYPRIPPGLRAGQAAMLQDSISVAEATAGRPLPRSQVSEFWSAKANHYVRENRGEWLRLVAVKLRNFWNAFQYDDLSIITNLRGHGIVLPGLGFGLVAALALPGMLLGVVRFARSRWIAAAIGLHMLSLLSVFVTERYRLAAVPGLLVFAAFAAWKLWEYCASLRYGRAAALAAGFGAATLIVSIPQRDPSLWALDAYNSGWQALEANNLPLAERKLELARAYVPHNAEINLALGNLWFAHKDFARAEHFYLAALQIDPRHKSALSNLGVIALEQRQSDRAVGLFRAALEVAPNEAKTHYLLARAHLANGRVAEARSHIEIALRLRPNQPEFVELATSLREHQ